MSDPRGDDLNSTSGLPAGNPEATSSQRPRIKAANRRTIRIRDVAIGEGRAKTMASITEKTFEAALSRAHLLGTLADADMIEFRIDHLDRCEDSGIAAALPRIASASNGKPLVVTFRTKEEGGERAVDPADYSAIYRAALSSGAGDIFDIQAACLTHRSVAAMTAEARGVGKSVILSHHDFDHTPSVTEMIAIMRQQQALEADICKLAVMPKDMGDVMALLQATWMMHRDHADRPLMTMAMGGLGAVSRLSGEAFGSAISIGSMGTPSAPGQIALKPLRVTIETLHEALSA